MGNHRKSMRPKPFRPCYPSANKHNHWNYNRVHWVHHLCPLTRVIQKQYKSAQFLPSSVQLQTATTAFTAHIINTARAGAIVGTWLVDWSHHILESSQPSQLYIYSCLNLSICETPNQERNLPFITFFYPVHPSLLKRARSRSHSHLHPASTVALTVDVLRHGQWREDNWTTGAPTIPQVYTNSVIECCALRCKLFYVVHVVHVILQKSKAKETTFSWKNGTCQKHMTNRGINYKN